MKLAHLRSIYSVHESRYHVPRAFIFIYLSYEHLTNYFLQFLDERKKKKEVWEGKRWSSPSPWVSSKRTRTFGDFFFFRVSKTEGRKGRGAGDGGNDGRDANYLVSF